MSTQAPPRRRRRGLERTTRRLTMTIPAPLAERLDEAAGRYHVARSTLAAAAMEAGFKAACDRARRALRRDLRDEREAGA